MANKFGPGGQFGDDYDTKSAGTIPEVTITAQKPRMGGAYGLFNRFTEMFNPELAKRREEEYLRKKAQKYDEKRGIVRDNEGNAHYIADPNDPTKPGDAFQYMSLTPEQRYEYELAASLSDGSSDFRRTLDITRKALKSKANRNEDGTLNQRGYAKAAQEMQFGQGSEYMTNRNNVGRGIGLGLTAGITAAAAPELLAAAARVASWPLRHPLTAATEIALATVGSKVVDAGMKAATGQNWADFWEESGVNPTVAELSNPGYFLPYGRVAKQVRGFLGKAGEFMGKPKPIKPKPFKSEPFKSELDWSPESWFGKRAHGKWDAEDVAALESHVPECHEIERLAKENGTWLKMPDGSTWEGDPRSWVQLQSLNGQKLSQERLFTGMDAARARNPEYTGDVWADKQRTMSSYWAGEDLSNPGSVLEVTPVKTNRFVTDAKGRIWRDLPSEHNGIILPPSKDWDGVITDGVVDYAKSKGYGTTQINNVVEGSGDLVDDVVIHEGIPRKSLLGNNGNFDISNPNIYKGLFPFIIGGTTYSLFNQQ